MASRMQPCSLMTTYQVIDGKTLEVVGTFKSRTRAKAKAERLDLGYGAYRYYVKAVTT